MSRSWPPPLTVLSRALRRRTALLPTAPPSCPLPRVRVRSRRPPPRPLLSSSFRPHTLYFASTHTPVAAGSVASVQFFSASSIRASYATDDATIYALSSAPGKAGIAVIRVSGPACLTVYRALCPAAPPLRPRYAAVRTLHDPASAANASSSSPSEILDNSALVLYFPAPRTVTGEDVLELHVHGGPATVRAVLGALPRCVPSASSSTEPSPYAALLPIRYAEPGEFTRRAFLHDRLDLAQVEALGDTLDAETEQQRRLAVRGSSNMGDAEGGGNRLSRTYEDWRGQLLAARAEIEALIDFSEDQHFDEAPGELLGNVSRLVDDLVARIRHYERAGDRGNLLRHGIRIALVGPANAGKSSLLNLVVGRAASIVSAEAGTTRDVVEARLDLRGFLCTFADTAGFRSGGDAAAGESSPVGAIETEGMHRARQAATDADVVIALVAVEVDANQQPYLRYDEETLRLAVQAPQGMVVVNKCDLVDTPDVLAGLLDRLRKETSLRDEGGKVPLVAVSCRAAAAAAPGSVPSSSMPPSAPASASADPGGLFALVDTLVSAFSAMTQLPPDAEHLLGVSVRQQQLLEQCRAHLSDYLAEAGGAGVNVAEASQDTDGPADIVLAAEHLRYAANCLARITGRGEASDMEEVLGMIFEKFCVGK